MFQMPNPSLDVHRRGDPGLQRALLTPRQLQAGVVNDVYIFSFAAELSPMTLRHASGWAGQPSSQLPLARGFNSMSQTTLEVYIRVEALLGRNRAQQGFVIIEPRRPVPRNN